MNSRALLLAWAFFGVAFGVQASDWPQWRGADQSGVSKETGLLKEWPKDGPKLVWTIKDAGLGFSSFAIVDGVCYTLGTRGANEADEVVLALDAKTGKELWAAKIGPTFTFKGNVWGDGPRGTPSVFGNRLYALGGQGILVCLDVSQKGKELWRVDLVKDLGGEMMSDWGFSESPLVDGDVIVCTPGSNKGTVAALDKGTGKLLWQSAELKEKAPYSSVVVAKIHGVRQYIQQSYIDDSKGGNTSGIDAKTGKILWTQSIFKQHSYAIAPSAIVRDNLVYVTSGYGGGCHLFEISSDQKAKDLYNLKAKKSMKNTHGGVVLIGDHIYGHSEGLGWTCQDFKTGKVVWNERNTLETTSGITTAAEGKLYLLTEEGTVALADASPKEFNVISQFEIPQKSKFPASRATSRSSKVWSYPVVANGHLFVRDCEFVYCYDIRAKQ